MAKSYIKEIGDRNSHGVSADTGERVKTIAPVYYRPADNSADSAVVTIQSALDGKVDVKNVNLNSQTTTILAQVQSLASNQIHYKRFYTQSDGGSANISDKPTGSTNAGFMLEAYCNRYVGASDWRYVVLCYVQGSRPKIAWITDSSTSISWQDTDSRVTQTVDTTNDGAYPLLAKNTTATSTITDTSRFTSGVTLNPKNKSITATKFIGALQGNADTANNVSTTEDTSNYLYILGVASNDSNFNVIKRDTNLMAYGGKLVFYENSKGNYLGVSGGQDASSAYSYLPPSGGTMISVNSDTEINMAITDNSNKVEFNVRKYAGVFAARGTPIDDYYFYRGMATTTNPSDNIESNIHAGKYTLSEKCTLQFNSTDNALDFVFT